jgi:hypothetical protein
MSQRAGCAVAPVFGILLIGVGVLLLLQTLGVVDWWVWADVWRLWPLALVATGLILVFGRLHRWAGAVIAVAAVGVAIGIAATASGGEAVTTTYDVPSGGVTSATVKLDFGGGDLNVEALPPGSPSLLSATFKDHADGVKHSFTQSGQDATVDIRPDRGVFRTIRDREWQVRLAQDVDLAIEVDAGAGAFTLDLEDLDADTLDISFGAASLKLMLPATAGHVSAKVSGGASSIEVLVPAGVAARIKNDSGLSSVEIDEGRFPRSGEFHISPGFDTAENRVDLQISAGVSSIEVR